ncbi:cytochrome P450 family protein [Streptomyces olivaceoviridis]|uniref:cytochrome P450 family protein n=1 Tax=Streptomyces olivaceoviridis TaxID=1921 RepID=UPI0036F94A5E
MPQPRPTTDPFSEEFTRDPYTALAEERAVGPVQQFTRPDGHQVYRILGHAEARSALSDRRFSTDPRRVGRVLAGSGAGQPEGNPPRNLMLTDPPDHDRLKRLVVRAFTPGRVEALRPRIQEIVDDLLDAIAPVGRADLIDALAVPLPMAILCELLGVPHEDRERFRAWSDAAFLPKGRELNGLSSADGMRLLAGYIKETIAQRRSQAAAGDAEGAADLLTGLVAARDAADGRLDEEELISIAVQLLAAGHETTAKAIGNAVHTLLTHPDQLADLRADPSLMAGAVEELLRFDGPILSATIRVTTEDVELGGVVIRADSLVSVVMGAADRDGAQFTQPDVFDIRRPDSKRHLQLGYGIHYCLGAPLGRLQCEIALATLLLRFPDLELGVPPERIRWRRYMNMRGLQELPVTFSPVPPSAPAEGRPSGSGLVAV